MAEQYNIQGEQINYTHRTTTSWTRNKYYYMKKVNSFTYQLSMQIKLEYIKHELFLNMNKWIGITNKYNTDKTYGEQKCQVLMYP